MNQTEADNYVSHLRGALSVNRQNLFPLDRAKRRARNLRIARGIGYALADCNDAVISRTASALYGQLFAANSFDSVGVVIDNSEMIAAIQQGTERARAFRREGEG